MQLDGPVGRWRGAAVRRIVSRISVCFRVCHYQAHHSVYQMCIHADALKAADHYGGFEPRISEFGFF